MNIKRSYFKLLMASATVGLFLANCTVKNATDDTDTKEGEACEEGDTNSGCKCADDSIGFQECNSKGVYGKCVCDDTSGSAGTNNSTAGKSNGTAGTDGNEGGAPVSNGGTTYTAGTAGVAPVTGGAGGEGGAGPVVFPAFATCEECLAELCPTEFDACFSDEQCFSAASDGSGEYEAISLCIEGERAKGIAKRDAVRGCGVTFGASPDASLASDWAPVGMAPTTTNLLNCMATSNSLTPDADWANDPANFPNDVPTAWPEDSCAKLACTGPK